VRREASIAKSASVGEEASDFPEIMSAVAVNSGDEALSAYDGFVNLIGR
jgi:hypothetical protein